MENLSSTWISTENAWNSSINSPPESQSVQVSGFTATLRQFYLWLHQRLVKHSSVEQSNNGSLTWIRVVDTSLEPSTSSKATSKVNKLLLPFSEDSPRGKGQD